MDIPRYHSQPSPPPWVSLCFLSDPRASLRTTPAWPRAGRRKTNALSFAMMRIFLCCLSILECRCAGTNQSTFSPLPVTVSDLLLIFWPIFFVAAARQDPHLKVRNFRKSVVRGSQHARRITSTVTSIGPPLKRRRPFGTSGEGSGLDKQEETPSWDASASNRSSC